MLIESNGIMLRLALKLTTKIAGAALLLYWMFAAQVTSAAIITFDISQAGWTGGGEVVGMFSGDDLDNDGFIRLVDAELLSFDISFSGNATIPAFMHSLADVQFFDYQLGSGGFPPSFPLFSDNGLFFYDADDGVIGESPPGTGAFVATPQAANVSIVSEPATLVLLSLGLLGVSRARSVLETS
jgi:hypothetical protein